MIELSDLTKTVKEMDIDERGSLGDILAPDRRVKRGAGEMIVIEEIVGAEEMIGIEEDTDRGLRRENIDKDQDLLLREIKEEGLDLQDIKEEGQDHLIGHHSLKLETFTKEQL